MNGDSGATVHQHAEELRGRGLFAEVRVAFIKIEPGIAPTLASSRTSRVFVVPFFAAEGYFTRQAIPSELGLPAGAQYMMPRMVQLGGRTVVYCLPVGTHALITDIILARAQEILSRASSVSSAPHSIHIGVGEGGRRAGAVASELGFTLHDSHSETALVIAGHGTQLNQDSRKSIDRQVELISARKVFAEVRAAFLEEEPRIANIAQFIKVPHIVVVPFFMSDGLHVCEDIPVLLGERDEVVRRRLNAGEWSWRNPTDRGGKRIYYTRCVGSEPSLADVILERVGDSVRR
jgi:sirohydrochlorin cobaltochelatase